MLVLVSFVLVLAAAVTLVVGLLQSGLTLIYLSIACSVLAGVVLAVAVLRGRPEPRVAAAPRSFTPPAREQVPASVGAPTTGAQQTTSWSAPTTDMPVSPPPPSTPPPPPPPAPTPAPGDDAATKAAGTALLGRLRSRRGQQEPEDTGAAAAPVAAPEPEPEPEPSDMTMEMPVTPAGRGADDGFPIADYDKLRATELLSRLPELDRNQLEAVRDRETAGKNRFTILSRVDALLAAQEGPAWEVAEDEWEAEADVVEPEAEEPLVLDAEPLEIGDEFAVVEEEEWEAAGEIEDDEVDELVSPADEFPIAGYESLTVGQILPRLSELDADELAQVRAREVQGRARGTILDRIDRLAAKSGTGAGAMAMPAAAARPARKAPARKAAAAPTKAPAPAAKKRTRAATPAPAADVTPIPVPPATPARAPRKAVKKTTAATVAPAKKAVPATKATPAVKKTSARTKKAAPVIPAETAAPVKKARKSTKKL